MSYKRFYVSSLTKKGGYKNSSITTQLDEEQLRDRDMLSDHDANNLATAMRVSEMLCSSMAELTIPHC